MLGRLAGTAAVGFYGVGAEIAALPTTELIEPLGRAAFAGFARGRQESADPGETFLRLTGSAALLTLPAGIGLSLVAAPLVHLAFGPGWEQAVPVLRILAGAAVRVALLAALIPAFGLTGAAVAAAIGTVTEQALTVATALRRFRVGFSALLAHTWRPLAAVAGMAVLLAATGLGWSDDPGVPVLIEACAGGAFAYGAALSVAWILAGRPSGAESDVLALLTRRCARRSPRR
jgi:O-antigen/teichoic acid export membrane protein